VRQRLVQPRGNKLLLQRAKGSFTKYSREEKNFTISLGFHLNRQTSTQFVNNRNVRYFDHSYNWYMKSVASGICIENSGKLVGEEHTARLGRGFLVKCQQL